VWGGEGQISFQIYEMTIHYT